MFQKATKQQLKLRMGIFAPSGGGKTWTSLLFAGAVGDKIAYIDTENNSSAKYIGEPGIPEFDIAGLPYQEDAGRYIRQMIELIKYAQDNYDVIIVDSLTHAWSACKDEVDAVAKRMKSPNGFAAWKEGSTLWSQLVAAILNCRCHIICCARSKTEYVQEGKQVRKVGLAPELRDGMEYELDLVAEMDQEHNLVVTKTRCHAVDNRVTKCPGPDWMAPVLAWLDAGEAPPPPPKPPKLYQAYINRFDQLGVNEHDLAAYVGAERERWGDAELAQLKTAGQMLRDGMTWEQITSEKERCVE